MAITRLAEMSPSFNNYWQTLQTGLKGGQKIKSWTVANRTRTTFKILKVQPESIIVAPQDGMERKIPRRDFERVFEVWEAHKSRDKPRHELGFTHHSTYIITLLHWAEIW